MTASTVTLAPGVTHLVAPGTGACVELEHAFTLSRTLDSTMGAGSRGTAVRTAIERAALGDHRLVAVARSCSCGLLQPCPPVRSR